MSVGNLYFLYKLDDLHKPLAHFCETLLTERDSLGAISDDALAHVLARGTQEHAPGFHRDAARHELFQTYFTHDVLFHEYREQCFRHNAEFKTVGHESGKMTVLAQFEATLERFSNELLPPPLRPVFVWQHRQIDALFHQTANVYKQQAFANYTGQNAARDEFPDAHARELVTAALRKSGFDREAAAFVSNYNDAVEGKAALQAICAWKMAAAGAEGVGGPAGERSRARASAARESAMDAVGRWSIVYRPPEL